VDDVSFEVRRGECLGIIGRNGAGKSTLLKMLNGIILPDKGRITINGKVGALIEVGAGFHPMLTCRENVYVNGSILGMTKREIDSKFDEIVAFAELEEFIDMPVKHYSSGMYVRLGFAVAVQMEPDILLLDEVLAVGDARFQIKCINSIRELQMMGVATILVSHNSTNILRYSSYGLYLKRGIAQRLGIISDVYEQYMKEQEPVPSHEIIGNVPTDSGIELHKVYITDSNDNIIKNINPFQEIYLHIPYVLKKKLNSCYLNLGLGIDDSQGVFHQGISEPMFFKGGAEGCSGEFVASINELRAGSGMLIFGVSLWLCSNGNLLAWSRENRFEVAHIMLNSGRVQLKPDWKINY
jgi:ABC-type polysaccharide/polyol phosphate transport system ATPase subunit